MAKRKGGFLDSLGDLIEKGIEELGWDAKDEPAGGTPEPVKRRVSLIIHNPRVPSAGNERLDKVLRWNDAARLLESYINDLRECSGGYLNYEIIESVTVDKFPRKADGFSYTADGFVKAWTERKGFHNPDLVDYDALLAEFDMIRKVDEGLVDEFWLFAFPMPAITSRSWAGRGRSGATRRR